MNCNWDPFYTSDVFQLLQHHWQGNFGFQTSQWSAHTEVDAMTEGHVAIRLTFDIKLIWIRETGWIAVG